MRRRPLPLPFVAALVRRASADLCSSCDRACSRYALNTAIACRTSSGSVVARAVEKPPPALPKSLGLGGKSLPAALSRPNSTRQRGAACTNTGSMKAASIIADVHRPLATSHAKTPSASAASATNAQRPELMIARGSALRIQPPILTADTNRESASVAYATIVKSMARFLSGHQRIYSRLLGCARRSQIALAQHSVRHEH